MKASLHVTLVFAVLLAACETRDPLDHPSENGRTNNAEAETRHSPTGSADLFDLTLQNRTALQQPQLVFDGNLCVVEYAILGLEYHPRSPDRVYLVLVSGSRHDGGIGAGCAQQVPAQTGRTFVGFIPLGANQTNPFKLSVMASVQIQDDYRGPPPDMAKPDEFLNSPNGIRELLNACREPSTPTVQTSLVVTDTSNLTVSYAKGDFTPDNRLFLSPCGSLGCVTDVDFDAAGQSSLLADCNSNRIAPSRYEVRMPHLKVAIREFEFWSEGRAK